ncbi:MAG: DUF2127 domain-containing protein [Rhodanobacteraceae bacterium]|nr:DUF2127 domain-containing protein [Rhodanobacteraceae bacterium]
MPASRPESRMLRAGANGPPRTLVLIALYKLFKAAACLVLAAVAFHLLQPAPAARFDHWLASLSWVSHHHLLVRAIAWLLGLGPHAFRLFGLVALGYAALYAVQGIGLWFGRRWAAYLVVVETGLLLPLEAWELAHRLTPLKLAVLAVNLAIVAYLVRMLCGSDRTPSLPEAMP